MFSALIVILSIAVFWRSLPERDDESGFLGMLDKIIASVLPGGEKTETIIETDDKGTLDESRYGNASRKKTSVSDQPVLLENEFEPPLRSSFAPPIADEFSQVPPEPLVRENATTLQDEGDSFLLEPQTHLEAEEDEIFAEGFSETVRNVLEQLRESCNATQLRLEPWGSSGDVFRFSCYVPHPTGSGKAKKHFEAVGKEPLKLIETVTSEIQTWIAE